MNIGVNYRAFYKGKMYYVAAFDLWGDEEQGTCDLMEMSPYTDAEELFGVYLYEVELMQCTGLKDKNGKEIYEGDICRWRDLETFNGEILEDTFVVIWNDEKLAWYTQNEDGSFGYDLYEYTDDRDLGVIGNIYENADLLEVVG